MSRGDIGELKSHVHNSVWADYNGRIEVHHHHHHAQMTQEPQEPPNSQPTQSQSRPTLAQQSPPASTDLGKLTKEVATSTVEVLDQLLWATMGKLGRTVYLSIQDAIAFSIILTIPGLIYKLILGKTFSSYNACMLENAFDTSWLACYEIVTFKYLFWILITIRLIVRILTTFKDDWKDLKYFIYEETRDDKKQQ